MDGWVMTVGGLLVPIAGAMRVELVGGGDIQADETPVGVQMHDKRGKNHQAYLWQYGRPGGSVVFDFQLGRGRDGPKQFLGNFAGLLQTDGYIAYEKVGGPNMVHAACWAHVRRGLFEAHEVAPGETVAKAIVERIDALFAIDRQARERHYDCAERHVWRLEHAPALLDKIKEQIETASLQALPASKLGKATAYALWVMAAADALSRVSGVGIEQQPGGELDATRGKGEFIVHLIFKCLKTLTFGSRNSADTDDLFVRSPQ